jgi:DNA repair protein RecO (recombination protein O)
MGIHTTDAIVLRQYPYRETSVLVTCLTDRFGKIKGLVKGLRVPMSRHRSPMEALTLNRLVFYDTRGGSLHLISQCDLLSSYAELTRDVEIMRLAASCAELADAVLEVEEPQPMIFRLLKDALERLSGGERRLTTVRIHFILRLLRLAGFHPQLHECVNCMQRLPAEALAQAGPEDGQAFWSVRQGGVLCGRCLHQDPRAEAMAPAMLEAFLACAEADGPHRVDPANTEGIQQYLNQFLRWQIDRPLKTMGNAEWGMRNVR